MRIAIASLLAAAMLLGGQAARAGEDGRKTGKTGIDPSRLATLKSHRDAELGFRFRYPNVWQTQPTKRRTMRIKVGDVAGASCVVGVGRRAFPADSSGKPINLSKYLAVFRPEMFERAYPPQLKARIVQFEDSTLAGQPAKRFVVNMVKTDGTAYAVIQYLTMRDFGIITLSCGARKQDFDTARIQRHFDTVVRSFRF